MKIKIKKLHPDAILPEYAHGPLEDAGMDLRAFLRPDLESFILLPGWTRPVPTALKIELPPFFEGQIRSRSGLAIKGVVVANSPGTIDPSFRGGIKVILRNQGHEPVEIKHGDRIAQLVVARYEGVEWDEVDELGASDRGEGGFGSTGTS